VAGRFENQLKLHNCPANDLACPQPLSGLVYLVEADLFDRMLNFAFCGQRHYLSKLRVVAAAMGALRSRAEHVGR